MAAWIFAHFNDVTSPDAYFFDRAGDRGLKLNVGSNIWAIFKIDSWGPRDNFTEYYRITDCAACELYSS